MLFDISAWLTTLNTYGFLAQNGFFSGRLKEMDFSYISSQPVLRAALFIPHRQMFPLGAGSREKRGMWLEMMEAHQTEERQGELSTQ